MSNNESFIDEVADEVRRERLFGHLKRYGWIGVVAVFALVGGAAYYEWKKSGERAAAQSFGDALMGAIDAPDTAARVSALGAVTAAGDGVALRALLAAGEALNGTDEGAKTAAIAGLKAAAEDPSVSPVWRDLAMLRWLTAPGGAIAPAERAQGLAALAEPGRAFRPLALEQIALDKVAAGETEAALADFRTLQAAVDAPQGLRGRAAQMIVILGGDPAQPAAN